MESALVKAEDEDDRIGLCQALRLTGRTGNRECRSQEGWDLDPELLDVEHA